MLFDKHTLDLRMPWTRREDDFADVAFEAIRPMLRLFNLNDLRKQAIETSETPDVFAFTRTLYKTSSVRLDVELRRDARYDVGWTITFRAYGHEITSARQRERLERAVRAYVTEQPHLWGMQFDLRTDEAAAHVVEISLKAVIGGIIEPAAVNDLVTS